jgi:hypothetical protein
MWRKGGVKLVLQAIIGTILFIIPGYLTQYWTNILEHLETENKRGTLENTTEILIFALPTVSISLYLSKLLLSLKLTGLNDVSGIADNFKSLVTYLFLSIIISLVVAYCWVKFIKKISLFVINDHRKKENHATLSPQATWEEAVSLQNNRIAKLYKIGDESKAEWGVLSTASRPFDGRREIILLGTEYIAQMDKSKLEEVHTYFDFSSQVIMKVYEYKKENSA